MSEKIFIGIAGASASGKTLFANNLVESLGPENVTIIPQDSYYKHFPELTYDERSKLNFDHPEAFDHDLMVEQIQHLRKGEDVFIPVYDYCQHLRSNDTKRIGGHFKIIIMEGILLFAEPEVRRELDLKIFIDTPLDKCLSRRIQRDVIERERSLENVLEHYNETVRPMYLQFIEPSKRYADIIIPRGGRNTIATDVVRAHLSELLG